MKKIFASFFLASIVSTHAFAESFYGFADLGKGKAAEGCVGVTAGQTCSDSGTAFRFGGGYQLNPNFALEASYLNIGEASKLTDTSIPGITFTGTVKVTTLQLGGVAIMPLNEQFSAFAKAGLAHVTVDTSATVTGAAITVPSESATNNNFFWGLGAQYNLTDKLAVRAQYEDLGTIGDANATGDTKFTLMSAGLILKF